MASGLSSSTAYPHLYPLSAFYYTNVYRWGLRWLSLVPLWASGHGGNFAETHKTWRRRFYFMDEFMPPWMKKMLPFIKKEEWDKEYNDWKKFKKYSEAAFGRHYRYPTKEFNNFQSQETKETAEINYQEVSSESL
ncbi:hypothetical protein O0L34_g2612 [Tuta absoluta]|nr:hypothetical protein O0L34_g2612 [Tuta absoluta]